MSAELGNTHAALWFHFDIIVILASSQTAAFKAVSDGFGKVGLRHVRPTINETMLAS